MLSVSGYEKILPFVNFGSSNPRLYENLAKADILIRVNVSESLKYQQKSTNYAEYDKSN